MSPDWPYPFWIAHRGAGKRAPENTLAAFREGAAQGFRMFECDVKLSADEVPFLLHDSALERTTSGVGTAGGHPGARRSRPGARARDGGAAPRRRARPPRAAAPGTGGARGGEPLPTLAGIARFVLANGCAI